MGSDGIKSGLFYSFNVVLSYNSDLKNMPKFKNGILVSLIFFLMCVITVNS
jgi:hypothetical protein